MYPSGSNFQNDMQANLPSMALMFTMYSPTFGNYNFTITPPTSMIPGKPDQVGAGFPSVPYLSLEALLYQAQSSNPVVAPTNIITGNTAGAQNINGQQTITNGSGQTVYVAGYSPSGFG